MIDIDTNRIESSATAAMTEAARWSEKIRKCVALATDERGDPTTREAARRQADVLMRKRDIALLAVAAAVDWSTRSSTEAAAVGLRDSVMCSDGLYVPVRP